jgi:pyruvate/2-oxoglutarate/acetoin dehydrogenase E1 component
MSALTLAQAFQQGLREEMTRDQTIFLLGTDLYVRGGHWAQAKGIGAEFGQERVRDTPISEAAMVAAGVGAALYGMRPIVDLNFIDFAFGAMDEIVNQAAKIRYLWDVSVPLVIRATSGVAFGSVQHNNSIEAWFAHTPGLTVVTPATPADTKALLKTALRGEDPVIFLMHKLLSTSRGEVGGPDDLLAFGRANICRPGTDVTVVAYSIMVPKALQAADRLAARGVDVEVIDLRTIAPIDYATLERSARKTGRVVVTGEAPRSCSVMSEVAATIQERAFDYLDAPVTRVGGAHAPIPHSPPLFEALIPQVTDLERAISAVMATR